MIRKHDQVRVMSGSNKAKVGKVLLVLPKEGRLVIEKVNIHKRHRRPAGGRPGGIIEKESPMSISNVMVICPHCQKPTRGKSGAGGSRACHRCKAEY